MRLIWIVLFLATFLAAGCNKSTTSGLKLATAHQKAEGSDFDSAPNGPWMLIASQGSVHFVLINDWRNNDQYRLAIANICNDQAMCQVFFWKDVQMVPNHLPMTDAQVSAELASWTYNSHTGFRELLWSCKHFERNDPTRCLIN